MTQLSRTALRLLEALGDGARPAACASRTDAQMLIAADLAFEETNGLLVISQAGQAHLARRRAACIAGEIDSFRAQHLALTEAPKSLTEATPATRFDESESPLLWLARRKGPNGRPLIAPHQLQAGERLRAEFTRAQLMPRVTANWHSPVAGRHRSSGGSHPTERMLTARQNTRRALEAVGPEFSGLLVDVCCFLKRLDEVERERQWPARSAKLVLQFALERLARFYGYAAQVEGAPRRRAHVWAVGEEPQTEQATET